MNIGLGIGIPFSRSTLYRALSTSLYLDFVSNENLDPRITFTRASSATRTNSEGLVEQVSSNVPRYDYDPVTLAPKGLLVEEQRTNLLLWSDDWLGGAFGSGWSSSTGFFRSNTTSDHPYKPGATVCYFGPLQGVNSFGNSINNQVIPNLGAAGTYTAFADYKAVGNATTVRFIPIYSDGGTGSVGGVISLLDGSIVNENFSAGDSFSSQSLRVVNLGNSWFRVILTFTTIRSIGQFRFRAFPYVGTSALVGDGVSGLLGTMSQLEAGSFPTSYIPTTTAAATRAADVAVMTGSNFSSWYRQDEGTLFVEGETPTSSSGYLASLGSGSLGTRMSVYPFSGGWGWYVRDAFVDQAAITSSLFSPNIFAKVAGAYKANDFAVSANGASAGADTSGIVPVIDRLHIGNNNSSVNFNNGHIRQIRFYPRRLSNAELQGITA